MISSNKVYDFQWAAMTQSYAIQNPFQAIKEFKAFYCSTSKGHYAIHLLFDQHGPLCNSKPISSE